MQLFIMSDKKQLHNVHHRLHRARARSELLHTSTAGSIRNSFRSSFFNRLKTNRSRSVDRFRQLVEDYGELISYRSITDLRRVLESDPEASTLMRQTEVNVLLNEIEQELAQVDLQDEGNQHLIETQVETEDILNRHLTPCKICQTMNAEDEICKKCAVHLQHDFSD